MTAIIRDPNNEYDNPRHFRTLVQNLRDSNNNGNRQFQNLDADQKLKDYLNQEFGFQYAHGLVFDKKILVGSSYNINANSVDGLLEILQFNEDHRGNATAEYIAHNCNESDNFNENNGFNEYAQGDSNAGQWIELPNTNHNGNNIEDRKPAWGTEIKENNVVIGYTTSYRRLHEGRDYSNRRNGYLKSPFFCRIKQRVIGGQKNRVNNNNQIIGTANEMILEIELLGIHRCFYIRHLNENANITLNRIYYPDQRISDHPDIKCGTGPHFHIEKWRTKRIVHQTLIVDPNNTDQNNIGPNSGTVFYHKEYMRQLEDAQNGIPRFQLTRNIPNSHTQPVSPY